MAPMKDGQAIGEVRASLDTTRLLPFLEKEVEGFQGPLTIKQFGFGQSNPTYFLQTPGRNYVLRRAPVGKLLSSTAHRVDREYEVLAALGAYNSGLAPGDEHRVPVPKVYALCMDTKVADAPFYVMEFIKGRIFTNVLLPDLPERDRAECWRSAIRTLALLSAIPVAALGLKPSFGPDPLQKPYFPRQVRSFMKISEVQGATPIKTGGVVGPIKGTDKLRPYFESGALKVAASERAHGGCLVHGDYKMDNLIFHPTENRVIGILDWELCTLGSPLADLANLLIPFSFAPLSAADEKNKRSGTSTMQIGLRGVPSSETGVPGIDVLTAWWVVAMNEGYAWHTQYARSLGHNVTDPEPWTWPIPGLEWVKAWMLFRLAVISQGIAARAARGQASSAFATPDMGGADFFGRMSMACKDFDKDTQAKL